MSKKAAAVATAEVVATETTTVAEATKAKVNVDSKRQKAFALLDGKCAGLGRKEACEVLMKELNVGTAYAGTIYQDHRKQAMKAGALVATYRIQGDDELKLVTKHVVSAPEGSHLTPEAAVNAYVSDLQARIDSARKLKPTE